MFKCELLLQHSLLGVHSDRNKKHILELNYPVKAAVKLCKTNRHHMTPVYSPKKEKMQLNVYEAIFLLQQSHLVYRKCVTPVIVCTHW